MADIEILKKEIKRMHSEAELRRIFTLRLDDELFLRIGKRIYPKIKPTPNNKHLIIWEGYLFLIDSPLFWNDALWLS